MYQWMIENEEEEPELLKAFAVFLQDFSCTIQYNGDSFDQPYLDARYQIHGLSSPFTKLAFAGPLPGTKAAQGTFEAFPDESAFYGIIPRYH